MYRTYSKPTEFVLLSVRTSPPVFNNSRVATTRLIIHQPQIPTSLFTLITHYYFICSFTVIGAPYNCLS